MMALPAEEMRYTFADYLTWDEDDHIELIYGYPYMMSPPLRIHQKVSGALFRQLANYLDGKKCEVYSAPFGVRLFEEEGDRPEDVNTVVEPDLVVVCDPGKLDDYGCKGAPDLVVEILSPSTKQYDCLVKYKLYQQAGIREYWIVDPDKKLVLVYTLVEGQYYVPEVYTARDSVPVGVLEDCAVDLTAVFPEE